MSSVLDLLINEVANILNISPAEVKSRFTTQELNDLLNSSLCEPDAAVGPLVADLQTPCEEPAPALLPPDQIDSLDDLLNKIPPSNVTKCIAKVEEVNVIIQKQIDEYQEHKILLEKLIEYRDNYLPIVYYFEARADEFARITKRADSLIATLEKIEALLEDSKKDLEKKQKLLVENPELKNIADSLATLTEQINSLEKEKRAIEEQLETGKTIFNSNYLPYFDKLGAGLDNAIGVQKAAAIDVYREIFGSNFATTINRKIREYAGFLSVSFFSPYAHPFFAAKPYTELINFKLGFFQLDFIQIEKEKINRDTGERSIEKRNILIKNSRLLEKNSFFQNNSVFEAIQANFVSESQLPQGTLYAKYYNLFSDPVNKFFTPSERGLTNNLDLVDPKLKGSGAEIKREKNSTFYVKDLERMQNFYETFDAQFENRKEKVRRDELVPAQNELKILMQRLGKVEMNVRLLILGVTRRKVRTKVRYKSGLKKIDQLNQSFLQSAKDLDLEIARITKKVDELKPTPEKIRAKLKEYSPECFDTPELEIECNDVKNKLGSDPLFINTMSGIDPTLPTQNQICYWKEFSKVANLVGLLPIPNVPNFSQLRYWPVGLIIPAPNGLIKIPLPIVWIPLIVISTPLGNIVIFLTINGLYISPVVFFVSAYGFKQHLLTLKGPSQKFGYSAEDQSIKSSINIPIKFLALADAAIRISKEKTLGPNFSLSAEEKRKLTSQLSSLNKARSIASANGNKIRLLKVNRELSNLKQATSELSDFEKVDSILNKKESPLDVISDTKRAILNRIDDLGKPQLNSVNRLKDKSNKRRESLLAKLKKDLENNDTESAKITRKLLKSDGISLNEKIDSIFADMNSYYNRINFPKITIPRDASSIDPKQNSIIEFLSQIKDYASVYKTKFYSQDNEKVRTILLTQVAKSKNKIRENFAKYSDSNGTIDLDKNPEIAKKILVDATKTIIADATGAGPSSSISAERQNIDNLEKNLEQETDPVKRTRIKKKIERSKSAISDILEKQRIVEALALTPAAIAALSQFKVEFDPFAPCCSRDSFSLPTPPSPALPIFSFAENLLITAISTLSLSEIKTIFGGVSRITATDFSAAYLNLIRSKIPNDLKIPLPDLSLLTFASAFSGILATLFEPKAPFPVPLQPFVPQPGIIIDLNLLKQPLFSLLQKFLEDSLPSRSQAPQAAPLPDQVRFNQNRRSILARPNTKASKLGSQFEILECEPVDPEFSTISGDVFRPKPQTSTRTSTQTSTVPDSTTGRIVLNSNKDILPAFANLDTDFLNLNPGDLLAILKNFVSLKFDEVENLVSPFYNLVNIVKAAKGTNLNLIEGTIHQAKPYGTPIEALFIAIARAKQNALKSATLNLIDLAQVEQKLAILETALKPIVNSPVPHLLVAAAGAADSALPPLKIPKIDPSTGAVTTTDAKSATLALRQLHPLLNQDDLPPWERLSAKNLLFLLFVDEFVANGAEKIGFFRAYL